MKRHKPPRRQLLLGDARRVLSGLPSDSIDTALTSPPYFLLRNYDAADQLGLEGVVGEYVERLVAVVDEIARVLKPSGSLWLNLGDSYSRHLRYGAVPKSLLLAPERVLLALSERGWIVRNKVVWAKPNPLPTSVRDRLTCTWEPVFLMVRSARYYFDLDAIREPHKSSRKPIPGPAAPGKYDGKRPAWAGPLAGANDGLLKIRAAGHSGHPLGKNPGDLWNLATARYAGAHFATFPPRLLTKPLLATCPERTCARCGQPWRRRGNQLRPSCDCATDWLPGLVLDPFMGAGTTAVEAERLGRDWLGVELNATYRQLALERITAARHTRTINQEGGTYERTTNTIGAPARGADAGTSRVAA